MQSTMLELVNDFGYLGITLLIFIENIFPPIPSEAVLIFGGFLTTASSLNAWLVIAASTAGAVIGAVALYMLGYLFGKERIKELFGSKAGAFLRLKPEHVDTAEKWFLKHGKKAVLICRCVPVLRSIISIPAGISKMNFIPFILFTIAGSAVWNTVLVWIGAFAGNAWETGLKYVNAYVKIAAIILAAAAVVVISVYRRRKKED